MGKLIEDATYFCGSVDVDYEFPESPDDTSEVYRATYSGYVHAFMKQDGHHSTLRDLKIIDTRQCRAGVEAFIERQIYWRNNDGVFVEFGPTDRRKVGSSVPSWIGGALDAPDFGENLATAVGEVLSTLTLGLFGSGHNPCTREARAVFQENKATIISSLKEMMARLEAENAVLEGDGQVLAFIVAQEKRIEAAAAKRADGRRIAAQKRKNAKDFWGTGGRVEGGVVYWPD